MAEIAVSVALFLADAVLRSLPRTRNARIGKSYVSDQVGDLAHQLKLMQAYVREKEGNETSDVAKELVKQSRDYAYEIEDILDEFRLIVPNQVHTYKVTIYASKMSHYPRDRIAIRHLSNSITRIQGKINQFLLSHQALFHVPEAASSSGTSLEDCGTHLNLLDDEITGYEEQRKSLLDILTEYQSRTTIISVVGPPGSGKSTLLKNVYDDQRVRGLYDLHAWVYVPQCRGLDDILRQLYGGSVEIVSGELLSDLKRKRYVVVLDHIWSKDYLDRVVHALAKDSSGSKIIFTTQNHDVARSCVESLHRVIELKRLTFAESMKLFCQKAFGTGKCPQELLDLSVKIVKRCEGLPFAIAALGRLLSRKNQTVTEWRILHDSLECDIRQSSELSTVDRSLSPSFRDLSSTLKGCLLYFSIFPEDYAVNYGRLIRLWVAEGFVEARQRPAEEVAEDHLRDLIQRNLVTVVKEAIDGRARSCRILNIVHGFIISKAEDTNFVKLLPGPNPNHRETTRRLSIQGAFNNYAESGNWDKVRTLLLFSNQGTTSSWIKEMLRKFKLLRVLDLQNAPLDTFPSEIVGLRLLRYLSVRKTNIRKVPKSIKKLAYLETFDLRETLVTLLPDEIFKLSYLRHLLVYRYDVKNYVTFRSVEGVQLPDSGIEALHAIQKLAYVTVNKHPRLVKNLAHLTQLRKLGLIALRKEDGKELCASIQKMENLSTLDLTATNDKEDYLDLDHMTELNSCLQRLYLKGRLQKLPKWISSLQSVVKIGLKWSRLNREDTPLKLLQGLANLMELELVDCYVGETLEFKAHMFKKLKSLHLEQFDELKKVVMGQAAMPLLEKLTICKCENLKMLPLGIQDLSHLEEMLLYDMPQVFIDKLKKEGEDRWMVDHVKMIHSFTLESTQKFSFCNLS